ncbi:Inorganic pyrophosphatase [Aspergillus sclerotialis]|uniref:inorganic diphosphatase n=1 Tax=Aspergillus sclerotialis TaxID=2070753 RepID=A0A3A2ZUR5_9EURO|nr:Inorganic pyrophosphatase [Aspergillus sclerotialis]
MSPKFNPQEYTPRVTGAPLTRDFRIYLSLGDKMISPWHDIPLFADERESVLNMVVEIPRWENVKLEIAKDEFLTPLRQDIIDDKLRIIPNIFPHKGYPWNYGSLPQTYSDPSHVHPLTSLPGDSAPLNVCELAGEVDKPGQIKQVKALGAFAVLENGKTDWKIVVVDIQNPISEKINGMSDIEKHMPGYVETMLEWFRVYKIPDHGETGRNEIGMGGRIEGREFTHDLLKASHKSWKKVLTEPTMETKVSMADVRIEDNNLAAQIPKQPKDEAAQKAIFDSSMANKCHYITPNWPITAQCPERAMEV